MNPLIVCFSPFLTSLNSFPLCTLSLLFSVSLGAFKGRSSQPTPALPDDRLSGSWYHWVHACQGQTQEAAAEHSHLGEEGWDCWGKPYFIFSPQTQLSYHTEPPSSWRETVLWQYPKTMGSLFSVFTSWPWRPTLKPQTHREPLLLLQTVLKLELDLGNTKSQ